MVKTCPAKNAICIKDLCEWYLNSDCAVRIIAENLMEIKWEAKRINPPVIEEFSRWSQQPEDPVQ